MQHLRRDKRGKRRVRKYLSYIVLLHV
jgi:hypothetical protein